MSADDSDEEFEFKMDKMDMLFPRLKWTPITDHFNILDEVFVKSEDAVVYYKHNEFYYSNFPSIPVEIIYIKRDKFITYRDVYMECEENWNYENGNHIFLERMYCLNQTQIELEFGS